MKVTVLGETGFPKLAGRARGNEVLLDGASRERTAVLHERRANLQASSAFRLMHKDGRLLGERLYVGLRASKHPYGFVTCLTAFTVTATRQK